VQASLPTVQYRACIWCMLYMLRSCQRYCTFPHFRGQPWLSSWHSTSSLESPNSLQYPRCKAISRSICRTIFADCIGYASQCSRYHGLENVLTAEISSILLALYAAKAFARANWTCSICKPLSPECGNCHEQQNTDKIKIILD